MVVSRRRRADGVEGRSTLMRRSIAVVRQPALAPDRVPRAVRERVLARARVARLPGLATHEVEDEDVLRGCSCRGAAGFAHVSCLVEQAKVLIADAEERGLGGDAFNARWDRWDTCRLCEQNYHSFVACALGWACWKLSLIHI